MKVLTLDTETTTFQKGNSFSKCNKLVMVGLKIDNKEPTVFLPPFDNVKELVSNADMLVGFNLKFDLHWLQRYGLYDPRSNHRVWDCQLVDFVMACQQTPFPSLDGVAAKYGLGSKLSNIHENYWDKGIDTDQIPTDELSAYCTEDVNLTYKVFLEQQRLLPNEQKRLVSLMNQDLVVLQQMEYNGLWFNSEKATAKAEEAKTEIASIEAKLKELLDVNIEINWNSHEELSALLYGGALVREQQIQFGVYKTGKRAGMPKFKTVSYTIPRSRLVEPIEGTELKKEGYWQTDAITFQKLKLNKKTKEIIDLLLKRAELNKLVNTYLTALPVLIRTMDWEEDILHGQFNQCVAVTGRLSSSRPNLQNLSEDAKLYIESRYERS